MNKNYIKKMLFLLFLFFGILSVHLGTIVHADSVDGLAMQPIYPSNQISKNGILNPKVVPGDTQELSFNVINLSNTKQNIEVMPNTAVTTNGPSISYSFSKYDYDSSMKYKFRDLVSTKDMSINLAPRKVTKITFKVKIPKQRFSGLIMGAFYIKTNQESITNTHGTTINNHYSYAMPVALKEDNIRSVPKLTLGRVHSMIVNHSPAVESTIYNKRPAMVYQMDVRTDITDSNGKNIYHNVYNGSSVAPNTKFILRNGIQKDALKPGTYHIRMVFDGKSDGKWILEKDFTVNINQYLNVVLQNNSWIWLIIIIIILLIIFFIIFFIYKKRKKNRETIGTDNNMTAK
jgi:hypothetical protein